MIDTSKYDIIIGLEIHIQSKTESKMFCSCPTHYFEKEPNTHVCPTCLGLPGALPVPNKRAIELCILLGLATNCDIDNEIHFDRKHYFYPDLPKGYQISQYKRPICSDGYIDIKDEDGKKYSIGIERIHQEEDVAKSTHHTENGREYTLIDYNKSGVPLIEIVSRPNIRSSYQAREYASKIRQIVRYLNISDADMEKGQMRCEPNISVQEKGKWQYKDGKILPIGDYILNPKVEVKNIGSISAVEKSIQYEVERIVRDIEEGKKIIQQTRGWNADKGITEFQRSKESADDYRYMPEPDIPIVEISEEDIERVSNELIELPNEKKERYMSTYSLSDYDSDVLTANKDISIYFEDLLNILSKDMDIIIAAKAASNWITGAVFSIANDKKIEINEQNIPKQSLAYLITEYEKKILTRNKAESILRESLENEKDLKQLITNAINENKSNTDNLESIVLDVINSNPKAVSDFKSGKQATIGYLVGQVMQKTKGTADPNKAKDILIKKLNG
ncbi:MAG TPA: Asp-tRNA(Asn)/Glu-tRNA(Gln) amidotransferase subunit GatB [Candidatus Dojkabacteria bacterium]|nr:Asp-tRNA(Asn)/Glu-tRNA(Gln) amidotransferase subunit GatB [Candidatus Dojkabacteria bacterium]